MPSAKELKAAIDAWQDMGAQGSLKIFLKQRFPGLTKAELEALLKQITDSK